MRHAVFSKARDVFDYMSAKVLRWLVIEPLRFVTRSWDPYSMIVTGLARFLPDPDFYYGLEDHEACLCCGGDLCLKVAGRALTGFCHTSKSDKTCEKFDRKANECLLPGKTCKGSADDKFPAVGRSQRKWLAFKAFKAIETACCRGWCTYKDSGVDFSAVMRIVDACGFPVAMFRDEARWHGWIGRPGSAIPGKLSGKTFFPRMLRTIGKEWVGDPLTNAFARMAKDFPMHGRFWSWKFPLPRFTCLLYYR